MSVPGHCGSETCKEVDEWGECCCACQECLAAKAFMQARVEAEIADMVDDMDQLGGCNE